MVEVGEKAETARTAVASGAIAMAPATARAIAGGRIGKGDVLGLARVAGIQAVKRTAELIPLCHPLRVTGVEMEALSAAAVALLTIYDMCKAIDRGMRIEHVQLEEKHGGRSGEWRREGWERRED